MTYKRRQERRQLAKKAKYGVGLASSALVASQLVAITAPQHAYAATSSQEAFITELAPSAQSLANSNDLYASVMIAQAILESNWGKSGLATSANNLFGIKGKYNGESVTMRTAEHDAKGNVYYINEPFRKYPSYRESLQDYVNVLTGSRYYSGAYRSNTASYQEATKYLTGRYATAVNYNTALNRIIETYNLTRFDGASGQSSNSSNSSQTASQTSSGTSASSYTVKAGDSIWQISIETGLTMAEIINLNNIQNNFIYPGQVLTLKSTTTTSQSQSSSRSARATSGASYTVQSGDSVWKIATENGMSMSELIALNGIQNNFIYPGQVLTLKAASTSRNSNNASRQASSSQTQNSSNTSYTVQSGDSVWKIANENGMSMSELVALNGIQNNFIYPGQVLRLKAGSGSQSSSGASATRSSVSQTSTNTSYTVQSGDSVWKIANENGMSMAELIAINGIQNNFIYPGQVLKLKAQASQATTNTGKTYTVKSGDSVWKIANQHGISMAELISMNNIQNNFVYPGQTLRVG